jgi:hypothetical protein
LAEVRERNEAEATRTVEFNWLSYQLARVTITYGCIGWNRGNLKSSLCFANLHSVSAIAIFNPRFE